VISVGRWGQWEACHVRGRCVGYGGGIPISAARCKAGENSNP
jgi:hypothetical protein